MGNDATECGEDGRHIQGWIRYNHYFNISTAESIILNGTDGDLT